MISRLIKTSAILGLFACLGSPAPVTAGAVYNFVNISTNPDGDAIESQLKMTVYGSSDSPVTVGSNSVSIATSQVLFVFENAVGVASNVTEYYFQQSTGGVLGTFSALFNNGTTFTNGSANPGDLPGGNNITPDFKVSPGYLGDVGNGDGINSASRSLGLRYNLSAGKTYSDVLTALANGFNDPSASWATNGNPLPTGALGLRVGLHVRSISPGGLSAGLINGPIIPSVVVPEPSTVVAALSGVGALALLRRRKAK